jgi:hypothetical protein
VTANFAVNGRPPGTELGPDFRETSPYVWTLDVTPPVTSVTGGKLVVKAKDRQGNWSVLERVFDVVSRAPAPAASYSIDGGGRVWMTADTSGPVRAGFARLEPDSGTLGPSALAIIGLRNRGVLVTEAAITASTGIQSGRIYASVEGSVSTGVAMTNPSGQDAIINFFFTDSAGNDFGHGTFVLPANRHMAALLNQYPLNGPASMHGTFTFTASTPVSAAAMRVHLNERQEYLFSTLPVSGLRDNTSSASVTLPHFAAGGGWKTEIVLTNPTDVAQPGTMRFLGQGSGSVTVNGVDGTTFQYTIAPRAAVRFQVSSATPGTAAHVGWVRIDPEAGSTVPQAFAVFSFKPNGITVTETSIAATQSGTALRMYVELPGTATGGSPHSAVAIANPSASPAAVTLTFARLDGSTPAAPVTITVPAAGHIARFVHELFAALPNPAQGVLKVTSDTPVAVAGLRARYNERGDFLIVSTPPSDDTAPRSASDLVLPHVLSGGEYTTQLILFGQSAAGRLWYLTGSGVSLSSDSLTP